MSPSFRQGLPESRTQGCEKQIKKWFHVAKKQLVRYGVAIHGFWISAIPAEMTSCVDTNATKV
jgi:hypothetical protein